MTVEKDWTKDMKDRLGRHPVTAPDGLLEDIRREMARRGLKPGQDKKEAVRLVPLMWRRVAAAVAAVVVVGAGLYVTRPRKGDVADIALQGAGAATGVSADMQPEGRKKDAMEHVPLVAQAVTSASTSSPSSVIGEGEGCQTLASDSLQAVTPDLQVAQEDTVRPEVQRRPADRTTRRRYPVSHTASRMSAVDYSHVAHSIPLTLSAYFSSVGSASAASNGYSVSMLASDRKYGGGLAGVPDGMNAVMLTSTSHEVHAHHRQPVRAGVSLRVPLTERWSVTAGVDYSYLSSDIEVVSVSKVTDYCQQLHYVGVPVMVNYSLWHSRIFNVYLSGGGEMQYLVSGRAKWQGQDDSSASAEPDETDIRLSDHRPQWSVGVVGGAEVKIVKGLSVYAEPGLNYYFDNGSSIKNIYKDKPVNFSLSVGMRWTLEE